MKRNLTQMTALSRQLLTVNRTQITGKHPYDQGGVGLENIDLVINLIENSDPPVLIPAQHGEDGWAQTQTQAETQGRRQMAGFGGRNEGLGVRVEG
jgi:hypothetical protein